MQCCHSAINLKQMSKVILLFKSVVAMLVLSIAFVCAIVTLASFSEPARAVESSAPNHPPDKHENGFIMLDVLEPTPYNSKKNQPKMVLPLISSADKALADRLGLVQYRPNFATTIHLTPIQTLEMLTFQSHLNICGLMDFSLV